MAAAAKLEGKAGEKQNTIWFRSECPNSETLSLAA